MEVNEDTILFMIVAVGAITLDKAKSLDELSTILSVNKNDLTPIIERLYKQGYLTINNNLYYVTQAGILKAMSLFS
jgi:predicted transcriptional regulator